MISEAVLELVSAIMAALDSAIPSFTTLIEDDALNAAQLVGDNMSFIDNWFPMTELAIALDWAFQLFLLPVVVPFVVVKFVYAHIPVFGAG